MNRTANLGRPTKTTWRASPAHAAISTIGIVTASWAMWGGWAALLALSVLYFVIAVAADFINVIESRR